MPYPNEELVSVIIPFLNGGAWLSEAIESVIGQSYENWEAILIDDGSEEEAANIARDYSCRYPEKIIYTHHPFHSNKGVTVSRNLGISLSTGSFIAFLDSDDCWMKDKLHHQIELFRQYPQVQMICEASRFWYSWNDSNAEDIIVRVGAPPDTVYQAKELIKILYPLGEGAAPCPTGITIRKEAFTRSGGFEESFTGIYQLYEDQAFLSKIYLNEKVYVSGAANNLYRKRPGSLTGAANDEELYKKVRLFFLDWLQEYIKQHEIKDNAIEELIKTARTIMSQ